ncbi:MAG: prepilin-type N-terminal cleavage/methylation domain-containing protein [Kiritimatiellae bacterium]|nr:prepilin-type N-terminal cleavage/methylation domain-containing protein [Kiritimatiellia bacterium]
MKRGFTLIELLLVIAIIAIISTLAVNKVGGIKEAAARKVSLANQGAVERAVGAFLVSGGKLNRLDSLLYAGDGGAPVLGRGREGDFDFDTVSTADGREGLYLGPSADAEATETLREERNSGLTPDLQKLLCLYTLNKAQAEALAERLGLKYVMAQTAYADLAATSFPALHYPKDRAYGDGSVPNGADGVHPNASAIVATVVTNGMAVAAVNPMTDLGRTVYQACGQELLNTVNWGENYDETKVRAEVAATGGPLLAFGLGDSCSVIGNANAGLESAPFATYPLKKYYSRYILLIRLRSAGAGSVSVTMPELAGVLDCCGNTIRAAQHIIQDL